MKSLTKEEFTKLAQEVYDKAISQNRIVVSSSLDLKTIFCDPDNPGVCATSFRSSTKMCCSSLLASHFGTQYECGMFPGYSLFRGGENGTGFIESCLPCLEVKGEPNE